MKASIIIISKANRHNLNNVLCQLQEMRKSHAFEIVVVEATDGEDLENKEIKYIKIPVEKAGFSLQRNLGVKNSESEFIIFVDDDIILSKKWYPSLLLNLTQEKNIVGAMGAVFPYKPSLVGFCEGVLGHPGGGFRLHHHSRGKILPLSQVATLNTAMRRSAIEEVGLFDTNFKYGSEDTELSIRVTHKFGKKRFLYNPEALVYHQPRNRIQKIIPWYIRRGKGDADLFLEHATHLGYLLSSSICLKIFPFLLLSLLLKNFAFLLVPFSIWYLLQLDRHKFMFNYFKIYNFRKIKKISTFLIFPLIKLLADLMFDLGRVLRIFKL